MRKLKSNQVPSGRVDGARERPSFQRFHHRRTASQLEPDGRAGGRHPRSLGRTDLSNTTTGAVCSDLAELRTYIARYTSGSASSASNVVLCRLVRGLGGRPPALCRAADWGPRLRTGPPGLGDLQDLAVGAFRADLGRPRMCHMRRLPRSACSRSNGSSCRSRALPAAGDEPRVVPG